MNSSDFITEPDDVTVGALSEKLEGVELLYSSQEGSDMLYKCQLWGRSHVVKSLKVQYRGTDFYEAALFKEFSIGFQLEHPHICRTISWKQIPQLGNCFIMEYVDGITLSDFIAQGKLTAKNATSILLELLDALEYIHNKQVIHRDIKPSNIMITHNGMHVKLIDFSLSDCDDFNILKVPAGTRRYLAPETFHKDEKVDCRADIYSLGVVMEEMAEVLDSGFLRSVAGRCVVKERERRISSVAEIRKLLTCRPAAVNWRNIILAVAAVVVLGVFVGLKYRRNEASVQTEPPVYGNVAYGMECRNILAKERARVASMDVSMVNAADSAGVMKRLKDALDKEYPMPVQKTSAAYSKIWESLKAEVAGIYRK